MRHTRFPVVLALLVATAAVGRAEILDRVLAIVAGQMITLTDVTAARDFRLVEAAPGPDPVGDLLPRLIDRELILAEVDRYAPPDPAPDAVDAEFSARRARFATDQAFEQALLRSGINAGRLRETLRQNLRIQSYLDERFAATGRDQLVSEWVAGLRRRGDIVDLSVTAR